MHTLSAFPLNPTKVPRRVYRFCEAESDTERSEYGAPTTSNRASVVFSVIILANKGAITQRLLVEHTSRFNRTGCVCEGQVVPVDRKLLRRRRANLNASCLAVHTRKKSSPRQSPDTSLERWTHGA